MAKGIVLSVPDGSESRQPSGDVRRCLAALVCLNSRIWRHLPGSVQLLPPGRLFGRHVHWVVRRHAERQQYFGTFFLRNRPELELMRRLVDRRDKGSGVEIAVLACSKGAEVYSIA